MGDIVDSAVAVGSFKTLVAAVQAAGLVETLKGAGPFTVFAPDDDAFAKLPAGTLDELLKNVPKLKAILMYHIIAGKLMVHEINQLKTIKTFQGQDVNIKAAHWWTSHYNPLINDAHVIKTNIEASNGMIQALNKVLMPNMELTCSVCGMGFLTMDALNAHTGTAHIPEKAPEPAPVMEKAPEAPMPVVEKMPEQMLAEVTPTPLMMPEQVPTAIMPTPPAENVPVVEKTHEPTPPTEAVTPSADVPSVAEKPQEPMQPAEVMPKPMPTKAKMAGGFFEVMCDVAGKYRFHLKAANRQIIAVSQAYGTKESALKGIASIQKNAPIAEIADFTTTKRPRQS